MLELGKSNLRSQHRCCCHRVAKNFDNQGLSVEAQGWLVSSKYEITSMEIYPCAWRITKTLMHCSPVDKDTTKNKPSGQDHNGAHLPP